MAARNLRAAEVALSSVPLLAAGATARYVRTKAPGLPYQTLGVVVINAYQRWLLATKG